ncbi:MAG: FtsX-like permease family protein, partial [Bacteroidota bacterium]
MWRNYLKTAVRNLWKNRIHGLINLLGLSLGVAGSLILFLYVRYHSSFESHIPDADRIHRLAIEFELQGEMVKGPIAMIPAIDIIRNEMPQVEVSTFLDMKGGGQLSILEGDRLNQFSIDDGIFRADSLIFEVFPQTFVSGTAKGFAENPLGAVISEEMAMRFFETTDVVGRSVIYNEDEEYIIEGVIANPPRQTDLNFHVLLATSPEQARYDAMGWGSLSSSYQCFFRMRPGQESVLVADRITEEIIEGSDDWDNDFFCRTQPLLDIHNNDELDSISVPIVAYSRLTELSILSLILVLLACVNFVNLATALASHRAKEVGIRKSLGSVRKQLMAQFLGETALVVLLALIFGMVLAELALIQLDKVLSIELRLFDSNPLEMAVYLVVTLVFVVIVSGLYPSVVMSSFQPIKALKEAPTRMATGKFNLRKALVVFQFSVSQFMIIYTVVVIMQNEFMADRDLGLEVNAKMVVPIGRNLADRAEAFQDALEGVPG